MAWQHLSIDVYDDSSKQMTKHASALLLTMWSVDQQNWSWEPFRKTQNLRRHPTPTESVCGQQDLQVTYPYEVCLRSSELKIISC